MHVCPETTGPVPHVGGPIIVGSPTVFIGGLPAARVSDLVTCVGPPDVIVAGSPTVLINGLPAARMGDQTAHGGTIILGCPTVLIGTAAGGGGGGAPDASQFSPSRRGYHHYVAGPNVVCTAKQQCSKAEIVDQLSRFAVPGQDPALPVKSKDRSTVYAPGTDIPVGIVTSNVSPDGLSITNTTNPEHIFYNGRITRTASQADDGSWSVTTEGVGNNVVPGMAEINQETGPGIFNNLDTEMANNITAHHGPP